MASLLRVGHGGIAVTSDRRSRRAHLDIDGGISLDAFLRGGAGSSGFPGPVASGCHAGAMSGTEVLVGIVILVGLAGVVVPLLPGALLVVAAILVWALDEGSGTAWPFTVAAIAVVAVGQVVKYTIPGQQLKASGVPNRSLIVGGLLGIVGFFVVPVIGLVIGFVLGVYLSEVRRVGRHLAWPSTVAAMKAVGLSIFVELVAGLLAAGVWTVGALNT
jgi:hypothetical protein